MENLAGKRFGMLTVDRLSPNRSKSGKRMWECTCDCGGKKLASTSELTSGYTDNCGCMRGRRIATRKIRHGMTGTRLYRIWEAMKRRCNCDKANNYKNYGGRGIFVVSSWNRFEPFMEWALSHGYDESLSLDRIDVNGDYCPENCRWIPIKEQAYNKTTSAMVSYAGETKTVAEWSLATGIPYDAIYQRIYRLHWEPERALTLPVCVGRNQFNGA